MKARYIAAIIVGLSGSPTFADAQAAPPNTISSSDKDAFALGYSLAHFTNHAFNFVDSVKQISATDDNVFATQHVSDLIARGEALRQQEAYTLHTAALMIRRIGGPAKFGAWAETTADGLDHPIGIASKRTDVPYVAMTEQLGAIVDETGQVQKQLNDMLTESLPVLRLLTSPSVAWSVDLGAYAENVHEWDGDDSAIQSLQLKATRLLEREPADTPADVDAILRAILPSKPSVPTLSPGPGNLSMLLPTHATAIATAALRHAPTVLIYDYGATATVVSLDSPSDAPSSN